MACSFRSRRTTVLTLTGAEAGSLRRRDPVQDARDGEADVVHGHERLVVEGVQADGDPVQARIGQERAFAARSEALVVRVRSSTPSMHESMRTSSSRLRRTAARRR